MWAHSHTESPTRATQSRCITLWLVEELKNLSRNSTFPTHKCTTVKKGEAPPPCLSPFAYFPLVTTQIHPPGCHGLQASQQSCSPWQHQPRRALGCCPHFGCTHELLSLPPCQPGALNQGQHPNSGKWLIHRQHICWLRVTTRITQPNLPTCFILHNQGIQTPKSSGTFRILGSHDVLGLLQNQKHKVMQKLTFYLSRLGYCFRHGAALLFALGFI